MENLEEIQKYRGTYFNGEWPTLIEMLNLAALRWGDLDYFVVYRKDQEVTYTFKEVLENVKRIGNYLIEQGIKKGDKVILRGKNSPEWGLAYFSILYAGAIVVPIDNFMEMPKMINLAKFCEAKFMFGDAATLNNLHKTFEDKESEKLKIAWLDSLIGEKEVILISNDFSEPNCLCNLKSTEHPVVKITENDNAALLFTSGTTGNEKGVMLKESNLVSDVFMASDDFFFPLGTNDTMIAFLPLHHSYCCTAVLLEGPCMGNRVLFGSSMSINGLIKEMKKAKVTFFMGIPLVYNKLLFAAMKKVKEKSMFSYYEVRFLMGINRFMKKVFNINPGKKWFKPILDGLGFENMHVLICGAGPLSAKVFKDYQGLGLDFVQGYGLTETSPILTLNPIKHFKVKSVGRVFDMVDMKIINPDLLGIGEIVVKGPNVSEGYYNDPENTKKLFTEDGYLKTGDLGKLDKQHYLYLKGRAKNLIVTNGGKNVYPEEIEDKFQLFEEINQILVRGYKDLATNNELIEALIYPDPTIFEGKNSDDIKKSIDDIVEQVNSKQVYYCKITRVKILNKPMEMTTTKKIKRGFVL